MVKYTGFIENEDEAEMFAEHNLNMRVGDILTLGLRHAYIRRIDGRKTRDHTSMGLSHGTRYILVEY